MSEYKVTRHEHGVAIGPGCPISDLLVLAKSYEKEHGFDIADSAIASKIGAAMVFTTKKGGDAWRKELGITKEWLEEQEKKFEEKWGVKLQAGRVAPQTEEKDAEEEPQLEG